MTIDSSTNAATDIAATPPPSTPARVQLGDDWLSLEPGSLWILDAQQVSVECIVAVDRVVVRKVATGECVEVERSALTPIPLSAVRAPEADLLETRDPAELELAREKEAALSPYLDGAPLRQPERHALAQRFNVDIATIKRWLTAYREVRSFTAFLQRRRGPAVGVSQLAEPVEAIIHAAIQEELDINDDLTVRTIWDRIEQRCKAANLRVPGTSTVQRRIKQHKQDRNNLPAHQRREFDRERKLVQGSLAVEGPLQPVQVDHTPVGIPLMCPVSGKPLPCPWITIVFDVATRVVLGFCLTLEHPSQLSTALALHRAVFPKDSWLQSIGAAGPWPFYGIMRALHMDNAAEFVSPHFKHAARRWTIDLYYRRKGEPQDGGHIERFLGTLTTRIQALRGASRHRRWQRRAKTRSTFTLRALETWIANEITAYHFEPHRGLNEMTPAQAWERAWTTPNGMAAPVYPRQEREFLISFLPGFWRVVTREGVEWGCNRYRCEDLQPFVQKRRLQRFRYDPRDITRIYFDCGGGRHIEVPWTRRDLPKLSLWEWRELKRLLRVPRRDSDSQHVHRAREANRELIRQQAATSQKARGRLAREIGWNAALPPPQPAPALPLLPAVTSLNSPLTFEILE